jgi:anti-sigma regulatory factor (Ser/Thr protein kinase)
VNERRPADADDALRLRVAPDAAGLASGQHAIREFLAVANVTERAAYHAALAFEELLTNVIRHGRPAGDAPVDVSIRVTDARVTLEFTDDGPPFDPLTVPAPTQPASIDEATIGGLGIFLVRSAAEHMAYQRIGGRNHLTVAIAQQGD